MKIFLASYFVCILVSILSASKLTHLDLSPHKHLLTLYCKHQHNENSEEQKQLYLKIDFDNKQIIADKKYEGKPLYIDRGYKYQLTQSATIQFNHIMKEVDHRGKNLKEEVDGVVGFHPDSQFFKSIGSILKDHQFKLWFKIYQNTIQIVRQKCSNALFPPFQLEMQTTSKSQYVTIDNISLNFSPRTKKFQNFLQKHENPFTLSHEQFRMRINLQFLNQVQTIPLRSLISEQCLMVAGSNKYQCDLTRKERAKEKQKNHSDDFGLLLFQFDPVVCTDKLAIQLKQQGKIDSHGYYWTHVLLILINIGLLALFNFRRTIQRSITCFIKSRKYH